MCEVTTVFTPSTIVYNVYVNNIWLILCSKDNTQLVSGDTTGMVFCHCTKFIERPQMSLQVGL
jgi:hypothetical protein